MENESGNESYFESHWDKLKTTQFPSSKIITAQKFLAPAISALEKPSRSDWLDAGCGDGVHLYVLSKLYGVKALTGIDISSTALARAKELLENQKVNLHLQIY